MEGNDLPMGKWFKISGMFDMSDFHLKPDYKTELFFWNNSNCNILVDDFYLVFGGPQPRKGDSTLTDLTRGTPFIPKFNAPPYPFKFFGREGIGNGNSSFIINHGKLKEGDISPYDRIYSGHFISGTNSCEDLLVIDKSGNIGIFTFCKNDRTFRKITPVIPQDLQPFFQSSDIISGCLSGGGNTQLLLSGPNGLLVGEFEKITNTCSGDDGKSSFKILLKIPVNPFLSGKAHLLATDLDGNKTDEILAVSENGSWKLFRYAGGKKPALTGIASGESDPLKQWTGSRNNYKITSGRFLEKFPQDILLTVSGENSKPGFSWSIIRFDPASKSFIPCFNEKQNHFGKTIGPDSLKTSDEFITGSFDNDGKIKVFRYNRDWRYDLKEIRFNDSTFQVIANMDFNGYDKDFNPKYYEILRIVPAMLINPVQSMLLLIGKNCKARDPKTKECKEFIDLPALPGSIQIYSLGKEGK